MEISTIEWEDRPRFTKEDIEQMLIDSLCGDEQRAIQNGEIPPKITQEEFEKIAQGWYESSEAEWLKDHPEPEIKTSTYSVGDVSPTVVTLDDASLDAFNSIDGTEI